MLVDMVRNRTHNLHNEIIRAITPTNEGTTDVLLSAVGYRPVEINYETMLQNWLFSLEIGSGLPTVPLWLRGYYCLAVEFENAYRRTRQEQRIPG